MTPFLQREDLCTQDAVEYQTTSFYENLKVPFFNEGKIEANDFMWEMLNEYRLMKKNKREFLEAIDALGEDMDPEPMAFTPQPIIIDKNSLNSNQLWMSPDEVRAESLNRLRFDTRRNV